MRVRKISSCLASLTTLLGRIKRRIGEGIGVGKDEKNARFLLRYKIGRYYVIGLVGRILGSMDTNTKNAVVDAIIDNAIRYDADVMDKMDDELMDLVIWIADEITEVIGDHADKPLSEQKMYYLRDPLRKENKLPSLYRRRERWRKYMGGRDPFGTRLCEILGVQSA